MIDLSRFIEAQERIYSQALGELRAGRKQNHWMWFIFPQIAGLGRSPTAQLYTISDMAEAQGYLSHEVLGPRLMQCTKAMLRWAGARDAIEIVGTIDALKFASSMTLFEAAGGDALFATALDAFFHGVRDQQTLHLLKT